MSDQKNKRKAQDEGEKSKKRANQDENEEGDSDESFDFDAEELDNSDAGEEGDAEGEEDDEEDSEEEFDDAEVQVNFVAYSPEEVDYHGIRRLLQQLWLKENIDLNELSNLIIEESAIASILKEEDDEQDEEEDEEKAKEDEADTDVLGIVSLLPFSAHFSSKPCVEQIKSLLLSRIPKEHAIHERLTDTKSVCALVINERFVNLPWRIALSCYDQLIQDLQLNKSTKGNKQKAEESEVSKYAFDSVIMICKVLKPKEEKEEQRYSNLEEEIFDESAEASFEYSVSGQCDSDICDWDNDEKLYEPFRKVLLFTKQKWIDTVNKLKTVN